LTGVDLGRDDQAGDLVGEVADLELGLAEDLVIELGSEQAGHPGEVVGGGGRHEVRPIMKGLFGY